MNIRQVEEKTGLQRANVRFYEQEGLLCPLRLPNGYRDYSEQDVQILLRIRLLRQLGVSIEDIRHLCAGEEDLSVLMEAHLEQLQREQHQLQHSVSVCRAIRQEGVAFERLDAVRYLDRDLPPQGAKAAPAAERQDRVKFTPHPWKRYFARVLDLLLYGALTDVMLNGWLRLYASFLDFAAPLLLMLLLEPVLLHFFAATAGKALLGIRVVREDGSRLSIREGWVRTGKAIFFGMGCNLFPASAICMYRARKYYIERECTSWDDLNEVHVLSRSIGRKRLCVFLSVLLLLFTLVCHRGAYLSRWMPPNRGALTLGAFSENYNAVVRADAVTMGDRDLSARMDELLREDGAYYTESDLPDNVVVIDVMESEPIALSYTLQNGFVQSASFETDVTVRGLFDGYQTEMRRIVMALADVSIWDGSIPRLNARTAQMGFQNHSFELGGVKVECVCEWDRENLVPLSQDGVRMAIGDGAHFSIRFRAEKMNLE